MERAVFYRRSVLQSDSSVFIEQRWYAHYQFRNLLIHEMEVKTGIDFPSFNFRTFPGSTDATLQLSLNSGAPSTDIKFNEDVQSNFTTLSGFVMIPEENNTFTQGVAVVYATVPSEVTR